MKGSAWTRIALGALTAALLVLPASASAKKEKVEVCKHGCEFRTIQDAVDATGKNAVINIEPGTYKEGVIVEGHKHDGLTIQGTEKDASKVVLQGKRAKDANGQPANDGIGVRDVDGVRVLNLTATNYLANGIHFVDCDGYLAKNVIVAFNRSYGVFAFDCIGGRMTKSEGYGHGDSAFYVGATPPQDDPKPTTLDHLDGHENILGFSGTNAKYVTIRDSDFYNNGVGVVPSTLDSEPYEPSADSTIEHNNIFWNNFNYFLPASRVKTVSRGLGEIGGQTINFPTGVGVVLLGGTNWVVRENNIFGNFKWGAASLSDPFNEADNAISLNNQFLNNIMGSGGTDTNAVDFFSDGSGSGNCWSGNVSSTFDLSQSMPESQLYPPCPASPGTGGTGTSGGNDEQFGELVSYVLASPPEKQECTWTKHEHPKFKKFKPLTVTPGPTCD